MRLKRLELQGFKSFMDRTILTFDSAVTGVVGPNGCGKSNIVDAILWVMGEQSPKHLRGDTMTDVIFNGSDTREAVSMAEVSLILDRKGVILAPHFAAFDKGEDISISRRIYRDGTNEYLINKTKCRLKDVHELFMDTGVGRRAYSIIEQGQIDRMINVKPEDRRVLFEEVAGITKYKAKRKEAERKLEATQGNLTRLQDIVGELEKQMRSLKVQATRAKRYRELKGELETVDLFLLGKRLFTLIETSKKLETERADLQDERARLDAKVAQTDAELIRLETLRVDQEKAYHALTEKERALSLEVSRLESDLNLCAERLKHLSQTVEEAGREKTELQNELEGLTQEEEKCSGERSDAERALVTLEQSADVLEERVKTFQESKQKSEQEKNSIQGTKERLLQKEASLLKQKENAENRRKEVLENQEKLNQRLTHIVVEMDSLNVATQNATQKVGECGTRIESARQEVETLNTQCESLSRALNDAETQVFDLREEFHGKRSRKESLQELQKNLEGYSPTAREILLKLPEETLAKPLAEILVPDLALEESLEKLLGSDMNTILVESTEQALELTKTISERGLERVRIVALHELSPREPSLIGGATPITSRVKTVNGFEKAAAHWLGDVYLVQSWDDLVSLRSQYPHKTFLQEPTGTVAHRDQYLAAGNLPKKMGVFARRREIEDLIQECAGQEKEIAVQNEARETLLRDLETQEALQEKMKVKLSYLHVENVELRKEKEKLQLQAGSCDREYQSVLGDSERNQAFLASLTEDLERVTEDLTGFSTESTELENRLQSIVALIQDAVVQVENTSQELQEQRLEYTRQEERVHAIDFKIEKIVKDRESVNRRVVHLESECERAVTEIETIESQVTHLTDTRGTVEKNRDQALVEISDTKQAFQDTCLNLQELRESASEMQKNREMVSGRLQECELKVMAQKSEEAQLKATAMERYQLEMAPLEPTAKVEIEKLPLFVENTKVTFELLLPHEQMALLEEYLTQVREKVSRYGEVNLTAINEFDEIQARFEFLATQKADLEKSMSILAEAIQKINDSTRTRFEETFEAVDKKFREIFPILFNGGKAELTLTRNEQGDAGVDVMVQPPGKRLQSIMLLSGGEKALTAVSLVLAIFARKPSPFCLLDEVDAPLDDANVSRFNTVIRKMAEKTQFIVITHNKKTMEIADALYGVTMERAGISRMASVRLEATA